MNNVERTNQVYFELYTKELGRKTIQEPRGWNEDFLSFSRDKDSKDIRKRIEIDLSFFGDGSEYLQNVFYGYGVRPNCLILKYEKSTTSKDETWFIAYVQRVDLATFDIDNKTGEVKVKAYEGGLPDLIKNRYDDEIDLLTDYSLDGDFIGPLKTYKFQPSERKIFLKSLLEGQRDNYRIGSGYWKNETLQSGRPIPFTVTYKSDATGDIQVPTLTDESFNEGRSRHAASDPVVGSVVGSDLPFFFEAEEYKELKIRLQLKYVLSEFEGRYVSSTPKLIIRYIKSEKGEDGIQKLVSFQDLEITDVTAGNKYVERSLDFSIDETLEAGESLSLLFVQEADINAAPFRTGFLNVWVNSDAVIDIIDATSYPPEIQRCIKPIDLFDRLVAKITGRTGLVRSEAFGDGGDMEYHVFDNGFFARGFPDVYQNEDGEDIRIQLKTSFKEAIEGYESITPMCWVSDREGGNEVLRIEPDSYTQQNFIGARLGPVDEVTERCSVNDQFSKIELGHSGSLEYEEVNGLDEPIGEATMVTTLGQAANKSYNKVGKIRLDAQGYELVRRFAFSRFPFEDTPRDDAKWIHAAKLLPNGLITHRSWQDDFSARPKGIFDPDSAWNLIFSPMNLLLRGHGASVRRCLHHNTSDYIRFGSSNANQNLITYTNGLEVVEQGEIQIKNLPKQRIKAESINMTLKVSREIRKQLEGRNDKGVRNVFGLIEYEEAGAKKYGRLVKLSSGESSKLELIKAGI